MYRGIAIRVYDSAPVTNRRGMLTMGSPGFMKKYDKVARPRVMATGIPRRKPKSIVINTTVSILTPPELSDE
jgi:hypothetical protein